MADDLNHAGAGGCRHPFAIDPISPGNPLRNVKAGTLQMQDQMVRYETDDKVGIITLDRASKLNAINSTMKDQIIEAFARADKDPATSVIVLRAEGRSFSAGFDIGMSPDRGKDTGAADSNTWDAILHRSFDFGMAPWSATKPTIASVQGHVLGGGCELTMMCDLTIAADDAKFGEPEVRFSHLGPVMVMPWIIGLKRAREMLLFGDMIDAQTALQFGMINRVVPAAELARRDAEICQAAVADLAGGATLGQARDQSWRGDCRLPSRARVRRRFVRVALCNQDRGRQGVRSHRCGKEPQGRTGVAGGSVPRIVRPGFAQQSRAGPTTAQDARWAAMEGYGMSDSELLYSVEDGIATITFNRPDRMNALTHPLEDELHRLFDKADQDRAVRVIILTGAGRAFCAGYDQGATPSGKRASDPTGKPIAEYIEYWQRHDGERPALWAHMWRLGKPIIAAVNGWAMGAGFWYQLAADITISFR